MNKLKLLTWLDIRRTIRLKTNYGTNLPNGIVKIYCYSDALEIYFRNRENAVIALKEWFKDWYQEEESVIQFDLGNEEYPAFKTWAEETLPPVSDRRIPFAIEQFNMDQQTMKMLEDIGVIYEDTVKKEEIARFYMPEIFREGLGFSGQGARPRIVALKRRVLGKGIL